MTWTPFEENEGGVTGCLRGRMDTQLILLFNNLHPCCMRSAIRSLLYSPNNISWTIARLWHLAKVIIDDVTSAKYWQDLKIGQKGPCGRRLDGCMLYKQRPCTGSAQNMLSRGLTKIRTPHQVMINAKSIWRPQPSMQATSAAVIQPKLTIVCHAN